MFIIDDILFSPVKGFMWIVRELHAAAQADMEQEAQRLTQKLRTMYLMLESGEMSEEEFEEAEQAILDRLDELKGMTEDADAEDANDDTTVEESTDEEASTP